MTTKSSTLTALIALAAIFAALPARPDVLGTHAPMYLIMAERAMTEGRAARAIELLAPRAQTLREMNERHRAYATLCRAHIATEDFDAAENSCEIAARGRAATWSDFNNRGVVRFRTGDYSGARRFFERAASLNPRSSAVSQNVSASIAALQVTAQTSD